VSVAGRGRRTVWQTFFAAVVVIAAVVAALIGASGSSRAISQDPATVLVAGTPEGRSVPSGFIGLSLETELVPLYFGLDSTTVNPIFARLIRALTSGRSPVLRIGGDSSDWTWWPVHGMPRPAGIRYTLGPRWLRIVNETAAELQADLILGVNLEADSRVIAATEARAFLGGISRSRIEGFELGNEPELYNVFAWYRRNGIKVLGRPVTYRFNNYLRDYANISSALPGSVSLIGPHFHGGWFPNLNRFLSAFPRVRVATIHRYPLLRCGTKPGSPLYPTIPNLLAPPSTTGLAASVAPLAAVAGSHGIPLRLDEFNSVACRGKRGVSNTFASALWVLDTLFALARVGIDGVNIHTSDHGSYDPFKFDRVGDHWIARVTPIYYGLLMFARAAPPGSRLLPTTQPSERTLHSWATIAPDGTIRVVLINDSPDHSATLVIRTPVGATGTGTLTRLRAPGLAAQTDVTIAGQTYGASTTTGNLTGTFRAARINPVNQHEVISLPAASAALLTIPGPSTHPLGMLVPPSTFWNRLARIGYTP
jgi:hypothetical protein